MLKGTFPFSLPTSTPVREPQLHISLSIDFCCEAVKILKKQVHGYKDLKIQRSSCMNLPYDSLVSNNSKDIYIGMIKCCKTRKLIYFLVTSGLVLNKIVTSFKSIRGTIHTVQ